MPARLSLSTAQLRISRTGKGWWWLSGSRSLTLQMLAPHCRKTLSVRPPSWHIRPTVGPELSRLAERKLEPMSWHFIPVSNSNAAGIPVFYLSPLLKGKTHCFWLSKHLKQQLPAARPGAMAAARAEASAAGKEARDCEFSGSTEAGVRGGGWFTRTPGDTHVCLQQQNPQKALLPRQGQTRPQ